MSARATVGLTPWERKTYGFIYEYTKRHGYQPSYDQVAAEFGWKGRSSVGNVVRSLRKKGFVEAAADRHGRRSVRFILNPTGEKFSGFADAPEGANDGPE